MIGRTLFRLRETRGGTGGYVRRRSGLETARHRAPLKSSGPVFGIGHHRVMAVKERPRRGRLGVEKHEKLRVLGKLGLTGAQACADGRRASCAG